MSAGWGSFSASSVGLNMDGNLRRYPSQSFEKSALDDERDPWCGVRAMPLNLGMSLKQTWVEGISTRLPIEVSLGVKT
jgi:hypothetical protein